MCVIQFEKTYAIELIRLTRLTGILYPRATTCHHFKRGLAPRSLFTVHRSPVHPPSYGSKVLISFPLTCPLACSDRPNAVEVLSPGPAACTV